MSRQVKRKGRRDLRPFAVAALVGALSGLTAAATQDRSAGSGGVSERLTRKDYERAVECGRAGEECAVSRYELCREEDGPNGPYAVRLITPFSRVATAAFEESQGRRPMGRMGPASVNRWGVALSVVPASLSPEATSIQHVAIEREGRVIQPIKSTIGPITTEIADGAVTQLARGFFTFQASAFEPTADVTIVLTGSTGQTSCKVDRIRLLDLH